MQDEYKDAEDEAFDLRPYMIDEPVKCDQFTHLADALQLFRLHHLRMLLVVNPIDGSLAGVISRKDLQAFMNY